MRWIDCFPKMAVLSGMICFQRSDAATDRFPNNNHIAMNIRPGHWYVDQMSSTPHFHLSDPGKPGVRYLGPDVRLSATCADLTKCDSN